MARPLKLGEYVVGVDIGGTNIAVAVYDHDFKPVAREKRKSRSKDSSESVEDRVRRTVWDALKSAGDVPIKAIGAGAPGPADPDKGIIYDTPNLDWDAFPLAEFLSKNFNAPAFADNDVNMGTYGEWCFGDVKKCKHVFGIFPGTGIGGGLIINGELFHGASGTAGEVGHMTMQVDGPFCGCGKRGCLEAVASRIAIAEQVAALAARYDAPYIYEHCGTDLSEIRSGVLARAIEAGDRMVEAVVRRAAYYTGIAAANVINVVSPEAVVLGGGLVEAMPKLYVEEVTRAIDEHTYSFLRKCVKVTTAKLGDDAVAMGAARFAADHL